MVNEITAHERARHRAAAAAKRRGWTHEPSHKDLLRLASYYKQQHLEPDSRGNMLGTVERYVAACTRWGKRAFPARYETLAAFFTAYYLRGNTARSLTSIKSQLKRFSLENHVSWLSPRDDYHLNDLVSGLKKCDGTTVRRKLPVTLDVIRAAARTADPARRTHLQLITMALLGHNFLLRGAALVTLTMGDIKWLDSRRTTLQLTIHSSKANKTGPPETPRIQESEHCRHLSAVAYTRFYLDQYERETGIDPRAPAAASLPLFPASWDTPRRPMTKDAFVRAFRARLEAAGFSSQEYSGHSFRCGGATDLYDAGCRRHIIQRHGRWRSEAWTLYVRSHPRLIAREVAQAFGKSVRMAADA